MVQISWMGRATAWVRSKGSFIVPEASNCSGPNPAVPLSSQMEGMRRLQDDGLVRHVGVSNFSTKRWQAAEEALGRPVLSNQVQFSLLVPKPARSQAVHARDEDRLVIAYSPLAKGLLGGKYDVDSLPTGSARRTDPLWLPENVRRAMPVIETVRRGWACTTTAACTAFTSAACSARCRS